MPMEIIIQTTPTVRNKNTYKNTIILKILVIIYGVNKNNKQHQECVQYIQDSM